MRYGRTLGFDWRRDIAQAAHDEASRRRAEPSIISAAGAAWPPPRRPGSSECREKIENLAGRGGIFLAFLNKALQLMMGIKNAGGLS